MAGKWEPFDLNGSVFRPLAKLLYVEEPDFVKVCRRMAWSMAALFWRIKTDSVP